MTSTEHTTTIPLADPAMGEREKERVMEVMDEGQLADGEEVRRFEREFADYCGVDHGVAAANGTTALHAALEALDIGPGDRVLTTPFSFVASANCIRLAGAEPVFADVDSETYNLDPEAVRRTLRSYGGDVDAMIVVHLYGLPAEMGRLLDIADSYDVAVVEDAAQAHGATYEGRPVGSMGDVGCFSFYPTKNMTTGEGGMIVSDRDDVAERAAQFVNHGRGEDGYVDVGHNFRMTSIAAAIGRVQLDRLPGYVDARRRNAGRLTDAVAETDLVAPTEPDHAKHSYHQYTVRTDDREAVQDCLSEFGIDTGVYYPTAIHETTPYRGEGRSAVVARRLADEVLSLPVHPGLDARDIETIGTALEYYDSYY
jgi:dTDP-4-amino-4,6-dideoxygalactose transaminase